ncbi:MAG TPA: sigma-70 family RNA polymerase sigma factor [Candidatus Cybelea sp.]|nr:sigma-70 family RNA polymerase sigma factor [Candidatus Cybelea sp.]
MSVATFEHVEGYRSELRAHCYRMLGSAFDAEDAVQETLLRAWRAVERFEGRTTLRGWLYRIATNVCLKMLEKNKQRRQTPYLSAPAANDFPGEPATEISWLEPYPTPDEQYEVKEATELAFVAAIAYLPPRQRAALLLTDVLGWSAAETARTLETSTASVNSALQRARETLRKKTPLRDAVLAGSSASERELLDRYIGAWQKADITGLVAMLKRDAIFSMPPRSEWYRGRDQIREFLEWVMPRTGFAEMRMIPTRANCQPAALVYGRKSAGALWEPHAVHVLTVANGEIDVVNNFMDRTLFALFDSDRRAIDLSASDRP